MDGFLGIRRATREEGTAAAKVWRRGSTKAISMPTGVDGEQGLRQPCSEKSRLGPGQGEPGPPTQHAYRGDAVMI